MNEEIRIKEVGLYKFSDIREDVIEAAKALMTEEEKEAFDEASLTTQARAEIVFEHKVGDTVTEEKIIVPYYPSKGYGNVKNAERLLVDAKKIKLARKDAPIYSDEYDKLKRLYSEALEEYREKETAAEMEEAALKAEIEAAQKEKKAKEKEKKVLAKAKEKIKEAKKEGKEPKLTKAEAKAIAKKTKKSKIVKRAAIVGGTIVAATGVLIATLGLKGCKNKDNEKADATRDMNNTNYESVAENTSNVEVVEKNGAYYVETAAPTEEEKAAFVEDAIDEEMTYDKVIEDSTKLLNEINANLANNEGNKTIDAEDAITMYTTWNANNIDESIINQLQENNMLSTSVDENLDKYFMGSDLAREVQIDGMWNSDRTLLKMSDYIYDKEQRATIEVFEAMERTVKDLPDHSFNRTEPTAEEKAEADNIINQITTYYQSINTSGINLNTTNPTLRVSNTLVNTDAIVQVLLAKGQITKEVADSITGKHADPADPNKLIDNMPTYNDVTEVIRLYQNNFACVENNAIVR